MKKIIIDSLLQDIFKCFSLKQYIKREHICNKQSEDESKRNKKRLIIVVSGSIYEKSKMLYQKGNIIGEEIFHDYNNKNISEEFIAYPDCITLEATIDDLAKVMKIDINKEKRQNQATEYETIKENYTIKHCNCVLEYSFREDQNIDSEILMEDKSKSIENFNNDKNQMIFEIFDGHGGDEMSTYLQNNLAQIYKQNLLLSKGNIILGLKNAFQDADDEMRGQLNIEGLGSTGTLVHVIWEGEDDLAVYSANVGDSRVCLISPEHIIRLSYDHRTSDEKEKKRILEAGMEIIDDRICGTLMLTRIFGNYEYKENEDNDSDNKGLICEPFISKINIDLNIENQFLILASDGILSGSPATNHRKCVYRSRWC